MMDQQSSRSTSSEAMDTQPPGQRDERNQQDAGGRHEEEHLQESQYAYPYHYIPEYGDKSFSQTQHWEWGFRYLGGMKVVMDQLASLSFESLVDIGCGDGRFLREFCRQYSDKETLGIDYSAQAIRLANAMNPEISYECRDIRSDALERSFEVATLIEVLEHIPPSDVHGFLKAVSEMLHPGGYLILTVPHTNKPVQPKHFRHYDESLLRECLSPHFEDLSFIPFDSHNRLLGLLQRLMGGAGNHFVITNPYVNHLFFETYCRYFLYNVDESTCGRIAVTACVPG